MLGRRRAAELLLTNRVLSAQEALEWGMVNRVVPAAALREEVTALASTLAQGPTAAHGGIKRLLDSALRESLVAQMQREADSIATLARQPDGLEGVNAFANKRAARFIGR
jgi:2-(1,2-epoxy-1,2-dihydrophenyl)acetyl-CoA isomerase